MSTATYSSNLPVITHAPGKKVFGPDPVPVEKAFLRPVHRPLTLSEKLSAALLGCREHNFSWPQTRKDVPLQVAYPWHPGAQGPEQMMTTMVFDSHQVCTCCGLMRFFNSTTFEAGPAFQWTDSGSRDLRQQGAFDVFVSDESDYIETVQ